MADSPAHDGSGNGGSRPWRHVPNLLTALRIAAVPVLAVMALTGARTPFVVLLIACLVGDVVDGALARALRVTSRAGALLDSIADTLLFFAAFGGALAFHWSALRAHAAVLGAIPAAWILENIAALLRYRRLSSFHTYLSRAAAIAMGIFIAVLFARGMSPALLFTSAALVLLATIEEFVLLWMLPSWTPDVRGIYWVVRDGTAAGTPTLQPRTQHGRLR